VSPRRRTLEEDGWSFRSIVASQLLTCVLGLALGLIWGLGVSDLGSRVFCSVMLTAWFAFNFYVSTL
jgi:hypothetical protein